MTPATASSTPTTPAPTTPAPTTPTREAPPPALTLFFDGACPLCSREAAFLRRLDKHRRLAFIDIAAADFDPSPWGLDLDRLMARMHAIDADGRLIEGMEVFRRAYRLVGLGWLLAWTGWPGLRSLADLGYRAFAKVRPRLSSAPCTDRCDRGARRAKGAAITAKLHSGS